MDEEVKNICNRTNRYVEIMSESIKFKNYIKNYQKCSFNAGKKFNRKIFQKKKKIETLISVSVVYESPLKPFCKSRRFRPSYIFNVECSH